MFALRISPSGACMLAAHGISGLLAGRYAVERLLGEGATATVHLARDTHAGISVAIKLLRPELAESAATKRFLREIKQTASLDHPRILKVLDSGEHEGRPYFVLPYMEGGTLRQRLKRQAQLPLDEAIEIARSIAEALDYAHARGLVHKDVKPENVLFTGGEACLGDFGIARALEAAFSGDGGTSSSAHIIRGTPAYMSPEQAAGEANLDGRSDQYALACVFYEMVTGMPAFAGPTPESIIAQRFAHGPREVRVYRPTTPPGVEKALARSLAIAPADRFRSTCEFVSALMDATSEHVSPGQGTKPNRARRAVASAIVALTLIGMWLAKPWREPPISVATLDTTRVAVLPFEEDSGILSAADLLFEGLHRYQGISLVESFATADAVRQRGQIATLDDAFAIARSLGAGRVVRGRIVSVPGGRSAYAALYDVETRSELHHARVLLPTDETVLPRALAALADSLVLRGSREALPTDVRHDLPLNLPALQAMGQARAALNNWDLVAAETLFANAVHYDPTDSRAHLWLAQVRSWQDRPANGWQYNAERAVSDTTRLSGDERRQAAALLALARRDYPRARNLYSRIAAEKPGDFLGWYGLGDCHRRDRAVIQDSLSPSGWSFRASYYRGMLAYARAFKTLPTSHRQFSGASYEPLLGLLITGQSSLWPGHTADSSQSFLSRPSLQGDTVVFIPYPRERVLSGHTDMAGVHEARQFGRRLFREITATWASALPRNAETKEAVAIALEMLGDVIAARDSLRAARQLTTDPRAQARLAAAEIVADVKQLMRDPRHDIAGTIALADSLLVRGQEDDVLVAGRLARVALLTGRCEIARRLLRRAAGQLGSPVPLTPSVSSELYAKLPAIVLGCRVPGQLPSLWQGTDRVGSGHDRLLTEYHVLGPVIGMFPREYPDYAMRFAAGTDDYAFAITDSLLRGNRSGARRLLIRQAERRRTAGVSGMLPEAGLTEAKLWLEVGDTASAMSVLDGSLREFSVAQPLDSRRVLGNALTLAALGPILQLRAQLATARGLSADPWRATLAQLWTHADPHLRQSVGL